MGLWIEPSVRRLAGELLGVPADGLVSAMSLRGDLGIGHVDLIALTMALEAEFGITLADGIIDHARTFDDLVEAVGLQIRDRRRREAGVIDAPTRVWVRIVARADATHATFHLVGWLTPYLAETIADTAGRARGGAQIDVMVMSDLVACARLRRQLARVVAPGVRLEVGRVDRARGAHAVGPPPLVDGLMPPPEPARWASQAAGL